MIDTAVDCESGVRGTPNAWTPLFGRNVSKVSTTDKKHRLPYIYNLLGRSKREF